MMSLDSQVARGILGAIRVEPRIPHRSIQEILVQERFRRIVVKFGHGNGARSPLLCPCSRLCRTDSGATILHRLCLCSRFTWEKSLDFEFSYNPSKSHLNLVRMYGVLRDFRSKRNICDVSLTMSLIF